MIWSNRSTQQLPACAVLLLSLGGCASFGGDAASVWKLIQKSWNNQDKVTFEEAAAVPYASIGVRLGGSPQIMLLLASDSNGQKLWTSAARISIVTQNGRIVRTAGLGHDLGAYMLRQEESTNGVPRLWLADFPDLHAYSIPVKCKSASSVMENITVLGRTFSALRTTEKCSVQSDNIDWSFANVYWTDPSDLRIWRSVQYVNPHLDPIEIEILRPTDRDNY